MTDDAGATVPIEDWNALFDATVRLTHRLRALAARVHDDGLDSAGRRGVLRELDRLGPRTVPEMARARPVSRQHIQALVDDLLARGLVERTDNPAHRRSKRIRLTAGGRGALRRIREREQRVLGSFAPGIGADAVRRATRVLERVGLGVDELA